LDGVAFPWITLEFRNGIICGFDDNWRLYTAGSTDINFSEEEAINIALDYVEDFSWTAGDEEVTEFEIIEEPRPVELITTRNREPLTLYPCWRIELYLDNIYLGNINRISLAIWADTGEVISCIPLGGGGGPPIPEFPSWTTIYIRADGTVEGTDKILREGDVYTLISDISGSIVVERSDVLLDGADYRLQGDGNQNGITLGISNNITVKNLQLSSFNIGIVVMGSDNNKILENTITDNFRGLDLTASENNTVSGNHIANNIGGIALENMYNSIVENTITNNSNFGIHLYAAGFNNIIGNNITNNGRGILVSICYNNVIYHNNFVNNTNHVETDDSNGIWDNGEEGNYWDNYNGTDDNGNGIGDTPYIINENNQDNYPLVNVIPEFPSWIILPLLVIATFVVWIYRKRITKEEIVH